MSFATHPPATSPRSVALVGAFGYLGRKLIQMLEQDPSVERIVAIDVRDPLELARREGEDTDPAAFLSMHSSLSYHHVDITDQGTERHLADIFDKEQVEAVCHLAFLSNPTHAMEAAHELESVGTSYVLRAVARAQVPHLLSLSSTMCYGARPDNQAFLNEKSPLRGQTQSRYIRDKMDADLEVQRFAERHPHTVCTIARMGPIVAGGARTFWSKYLSRPMIPTVMGYNPMFQLLHGIDAAMALYRLLQVRPAGVFNVAAPGVLPLHTLIHRLGATTLPIPGLLGSTLVQALWSAQLIEMPARFVSYLSWPWVVDGSKLAREVGFTPERDIGAIADEIRRLPKNIKHARHAQRGAEASEDTQNSPSTAVSSASDDEVRHDD